MRHVFVLLFFLAEVTIALCQSHKIDSLKTLLPGKTSKERLDVCYELLWEFYEAGDYTKGLSYADSALSYAREIGDTFEIVNVMRSKARIFRELDQLDSSNATCLKALPLSRSLALPDMSIRLLIGLTLGHTYTAQFSQALRFGLEGYTKAVAAGDVEMAAVFLNNIALIHFRLDNWRKASSGFRMALNMTKDPGFIRNASINVSLCHSLMGQFDSAKYFLLKCADSDSFDDGLAPSYYYAWGRYYFQKQQYDSAFYFFKKSWRRAEHEDDLRFQISCSSEVVRLLMVVSDTDSSNYWLKKSNALLGKTIFNNEAIDAFNALAHYYSSKGDPDNALLCLQKYAALKDSIYSTDLINGLLDVETKFAEDQKNEQIAKREIELAAVQHSAQKQLLIACVAGAFALFLASLVYILYRHKKQKEIVNVLLDEKIKQRTKEFEDVVSRVQREYNDYQQATTKRYDVIRLHVATLDGLYAIDSDYDREEERKQLSKNILRMREYLQDLPSGNTTAIEVK